MVRYAEPKKPPKIFFIERYRVARVSGENPVEMKGGTLHTVAVG